MTVVEDTAKRRQGPLPHAVEVADRWHLMENASRALLDAVRKSVRQIRSSVGAMTLDPQLLTAALQDKGYLRREEANAAILAPTRALNRWTLTPVNDRAVGDPHHEFIRLRAIRSSTGMMTMEKSQRIIEAGIVKAKEIGQPMNIAVVDVGANLTAFVRMDGAWLGSIDIAINKAFTAKAFDISTRELGRNSQPGGQFFGIHVSNHDRVMIFAGGIPIKTNSQIVGAVGVSGGSGEQDQQVAEAAVAAWS